LLTRMTGLSSHKQSPLTSQSHLQCLSKRTLGSKTLYIFKKTALHMPQLALLWLHQVSYFW
jgi:hypothetical protein